jgi:hypothetical protein
LAVDDQAGVDLVTKSCLSDQAGCVKVMQDGFIVVLPSVDGAAILCTKIEGGRGIGFVFGGLSVVCEGSAVGGQQLSPVNWDEGNQVSEKEGARLEQHVCFLLGGEARILGDGEAAGRVDGCPRHQVWYCAVGRR